MNNNSESTLNLILREFDKSVEELEKTSSLEAAMKANLASLKWIHTIYEIEKEDGGIPKELAERYATDISKCIKKFQEIISKLNGEARHIDLYCEQMRGRRNLINSIKHY